MKNILQKLNIKNLKLKKSLIALSLIFVLFSIVPENVLAGWTERTTSGSREWYSIASSSDGTKLAAVVWNGYIYTSSDSGDTWTERTTSGSRAWYSIASSSDGTKLAAVDISSGYIYTSIDSGATWTTRVSAGSRVWQSIASSSDGTKLAAVDNNNSSGGYIYTSTDSGATWTERTTSGSRSWSSISSSSDGTKLAAAANNGYIYTSTDSGVNWTEQNNSFTRGWKSISSSSDGTKLAAAANNGYIYTSTDSGVNWTTQIGSGLRNWFSIVSSSDGTKLAASAPGSYVYISLNSGVTWTQHTLAGLRSWMSIASSSDGIKLAAVDFTPGYIYTYTQPIITQVTPVPALTNNPTPSYTFSSTEAGTITYGGSCSSSTTSAMAGSNTITFNTLTSGTYSNCTITLTGSVPLSVNTFTIDTTGPTPAITYSSNPTKVGTEIITATYSEAIAGTPTISINQPGSTDITNAAMTAAGGSNWTTRASNMFDINSVAYGNGVYVAVGSYAPGNVVESSVDGITWTTRTAPEKNAWQSVTYGNGLFVAVANSGTNRIMTSPDGITWTARAAAEANLWKSITYGNGLFVAVASNGTNQAMTSSDGITWTARTLSSNNLQSVTYGNGLFVAVGYNSVVTSPDGITWTARTAAQNNFWDAVTYGNGLFVAVSQLGTNRVMTSPDGITWTVRVAAEANDWRGITYGNGLFVAVSRDGTNRVMTSPDGITWTAKTASDANDWRGITYGNGLFVAVSISSYRSMTSSAFAYSYNYTVNQTNGSTYMDGTATVSLSATTDLAGNTSGAPTGNTFTIDTTSPTVALSYTRNPTGAGTQTVTANYSEVISSAPTISINQPGSTDITNAAMTAPATTWTARSATEANSWQSIAYGNNMFVAVSPSGTNSIMTSPDGITWTARIAPITFVQAITYGNGLFVGVANSFTGGVMTSPDGITWTTRTGVSSGFWKSVTYGNGLFVAISDSGTNRVMTSPDGITWTARTAANSSPWNSVTYGNGTFVAVSGTSSNGVMISTNGINWITSNAIGSLTGVTYGNGLFVAIGSYLVKTSPDGITWTSRSGYTGNYAWNTITYTNNLFVVLGGGGGAMTSPNGITWTGKTPAEANNWTSVTYGNDLFVAVSNTGTNRIMTSPNGYTYNYTAVASNGSTYIDGTATVSLSATADSAGNTSAAPTNNTFDIDTTGATVALTYSKNPAGVGTNTITATYSKAISNIPTISINQPGSTDVVTQAMTSAGGNVYTYNYTIVAANGSTYVDGTATVSLSSTVDTMGNTSNAPTNTTFTIDTVSPTAIITYSINHTVKSGDSQIITATFNEPMADLPIPQIAITGSNTLSATNMTKVDATHYTYTHIVGIGNGDSTITLSSGTDLGGNLIISTPTSGDIFTVDNTIPEVNITQICDIAGNGCTLIGKNKNPQEPYLVNTLSGISTDAYGQITKVSISIKDTATNKWYNENSFIEDNEMYLSAVLNSSDSSPDQSNLSWSYDFTTVPMVIDHIYLVNVRVNDRALNYKIVPLNFKFTNSPPVVSNVIASEDNTGLITVSYDVSDIESSETNNSLFYGVNSTLNEQMPGEIVSMSPEGGANEGGLTLQISNASNLPSSGTIMVEDEIITYDSKDGDILQGIVRGVSGTTIAEHIIGIDIFVKANSAEGNGIGLSSKGTGKNITWLARTDADGYENASGVIKVVANDGSAGSMIGSMISSPFIFDAKKPNAVITFDAGVAGTANSATITIPMPTDVGNVEYKISDDSLTESNPNDTGWISVTQTTTIPWTFDSDIEPKTLKYQWRDSYGNVSEEILTTTPQTISSSSFLVQDTSNISIPLYDMYIGWKTVEALGFASYKLEYATSVDNSDFSAYTPVDENGITNYSTNYYIHRNLNKDLFYRYRLAVIGTNGNTSVRAGAYTVAKPDGVQNYGEGGGGSVATAPKIENVILEQDLNKNVNVTYKITDASILKKINAAYEARVFYNIGITLPANAYNGANLNISDASKLNSIGYIQINNEVIKYTGKTGNTLTGLTRGTWPTIPRSTRQNEVFFEGTPVWIMANTTAPTQITNTTIDAGQDESISWNTYYETNLAGNIYPNTEVRVLVHDNQDAGSGPLSNQNDFSENGILNNFDLSFPSISFDANGSTVNEDVTSVVATMTLGRAYPKPIAVNYTLTGTTTKGIDYTKENGEIVIPAGEATVSLEIPITNDTLKELNETIIITLSNPTNAVLGTNPVYTYTIIDNDSVSGIGFTNTESSGAENITNVEIPITLAEISGADTTVDYTVTGTATSGVDYTLANGVVTVTKGQTGANIILTVINDILKEDLETVIVTLSNPTNANLNSNTVYTYTITDDDNLPTLEFTNVSNEGLENINQVNILVSIGSSYGDDVTFSYNVNGGTAENSNVDYLLDSGTGIILAGETSTTIPLVIFDDEISESTETIVISLSNPTNAILGTNSSHIYSILDNEIPITSVTGNDIKSTSARISWTTADYTDSLLEYGTIAPGAEGAYDFSKANLDKTLTHSVYIGNLTPLTLYYFKTTSTNLNNETTVFESEFTTTAGPVISNVSGGSITDIGATITWTTDIPTTSKVNYSTEQIFTNPLVGSDELVTEHSVILEGLNSDTLYYYYVSGTDVDFNNGEDANDGNYYNFTTGADQTAPIISDIATPIVTTSAVAVTWNTNEEATGQINYGTVTTVYDKQTELIYIPLTSHLVTINELLPSTKYYYTVTSEDLKGNEAVSEEQTFTTPAKDVITISKGGSGIAQSMYDLILAENESYKAKFGTIKDAPTVSNIQVSNVTAFGATISFETNEDTIAGIDYGKDSNYGRNQTDFSWKKTHVIELNNLSFGIDYYFKISAMNKSNAIGYSEEQTFKTKFFSENLDSLKKIDNIEQFQSEIEATIESILPSLVPPFVEKPVVSDITESGATITFRTNIKAYPIISFTPDSNYNATAENPYEGEMSDTTEKTILHTLALVNLKPNTKYHFMVKAFSLPQVVGKSEDFTFMTAASKIQGSIIDVKKDSFTAVWSTSEPTSSIVEYKNLSNGRSLRMIDETKNTSHSVRVENLSPGTMYQVVLSGINDKGNMVEGGDPLNVKTSIDILPPVISNIKVDSALVVGRTDRVQTIVSWQTDEPSTSAVYYEEGSGAINSVLSNKQEDLEFTKNHVVILTSLKPGTVYRFTVASVDGAGNINKPPIRTIITPKKTESIVDVIFKNFDDTFNFINNVK